MRHCRIMLGLAGMLMVLAAPSLANPFVVFPHAAELVSPNRRFVVRNVERAGVAGEFVGTFHSLWLFDEATGSSRKLCDYLELAAVAWSGNEFLIVTEYVAKKSSRAMVFSLEGDREPVQLDPPSLIRLLPGEFHPALRENDHVFVEAVRLEERILTLSVRGYGQRDRNGFRWACQYGLRPRLLVCTEEPKLK